MSQYRKSLTLEQDGQQKKKDNIKLGGPFIGSTTYLKDYPSSERSPQRESPIKNPEQLNTLPVKLVGKSSYCDSYNSLTSEVAK